MAWRDGWDGAKGYLRETAERELGQRIGVTMVEKDRLELLEAMAEDWRATRRELDLIGWHVLDYMSGNPHEVKPKKRRESAQQARLAWMYDPMAGSATELMNDFVFGRGVPPPRAREPEVQKVLDHFWKDPDNVAVLTGFMAQAALGTDLTLQSNLFVLFFDDGEDGRVKLSLLDHDTVFDAVRDPENRLRVLYYVAQHSESEWDFENDQLKIPDLSDSQLNKKNVRYYAHWKNVEDAEKDAANGLRDAPPKPPTDKMGVGKVYHIAVNRTTEMVFGVPTMQRTLRWFSAYNDLMSARVDMAKAAAELIMKRKVKGTPSQLMKMAQGAVARGGEIATLPDPTRVGARPGSTVYENENVTNEPFKLDSGAGNAKEDATMIRSQVSAGTRFPQHYLGDQGNANLATATAMDLPVTKMVEARQELFEQLFRAGCDLSLRRAVEKGLLKGDLPDEEDSEVSALSTIGEAVVVDPAAPPGAAPVNATAGQKSAGLDDSNGNGKPPEDTSNGNGKNGKPKKPKKLDLTYEFKMPNALRRLMTDLVNSVSTVAKTFDPNGTNLELNRTLLTIVLGEALEMQDPADAVERIFPDGYVDPIVQAELDAQQQGGQPPIDPNAPVGGNGPGYSPPGELGSGTPVPGMGMTNGGTPAVGGEPGSGRLGPYGTKSGAVPPEQLRQAVELDFDELVDAATALVETRFKDMRPAEKDAALERLEGMSEEFDAIVGAIADEVVERVPAVAATNGHVSG